MPIADKNKKITVGKETKDGDAQRRMAFVDPSDHTYYKGQQGKIVWKIKTKDWKFSDPPIKFTNGDNNFSIDVKADDKLVVKNVHASNGSFTYAVFLDGTGANKGLKADSDPTITNTGDWDITPKKKTARRVKKIAKKKISKRKAKR